MCGAAKIQITKNSAGTPTTTSFTISMTAIDLNKDGLTYTLYARPENSSTWTNVGTTTGSSGSSKSISHTGLNNYTLYYWYITVTDGTNTVTSEEKSIRTMCPGPSETTMLCTIARGYQACSTCYGTKMRRTPCYETSYLNTATSQQLFGGTYNMTCSCGRKTDFGNAIYYLCAACGKWYTDRIACACGEYYVYLAYSYTPHDYSGNPPGHLGWWTSSSTLYHYKEIDCTYCDENGRQEVYGTCATHGQSGKHCVHDKTSSHNT